MLPSLSKISASWYPLVEVAGPTVVQKEKVEPLGITVSFIEEQVILILFCLALSFV